ncbi:MAG: ribokinase [Pseudomonadota bacterium]|jgi:ribokinase|nr:ribokinase [Pseudomonadota bacterium]
MILVFGSINADFFLNVKSLPRPGETVLCPSYTFYPGGKGANQAVAAARLGAEVMFAGSVGKDPYGGQVLKSLRDVGINLKLVNSRGTTTGTAFVVVAEDGENQIVVASGANLETCSNQIKDSDLSLCTHIVLQLEVPLKEIEDIIFRAKAAGCKIILNYAPANVIQPTAIECCDYLIMNEIEANSLFGQKKEVEDYAIKFSKRFDAECIITLGPKGSLLATREGLYKIDALEVEAIDTVGAGDMFVGAFSAGLFKGECTTSSLQRATVASGLACKFNGAQPSLVTPQLVESELQRLPLPRKIA